MGKGKWCGAGDSSADRTTGFFCSIMTSADAVKATCCMKNEQKVDVKQNSYTSTWEAGYAYMPYSWNSRNKTSNKTNLKKYFSSLSQFLLSVSVEKATLAPSQEFIAIFQKTCFCVFGCWNALQNYKKAHTCSLHWFCWIEMLSKFQSVSSCFM